MMESNFTVRLDTVFQGPMDLLLHLIREQEMEIHEIEISTIIKGYLAYLQQMAELDIELAGDFLVMASTLMAIKSRSLLPREEVNLEEELDPRDELIQRLERDTQEAIERGVFGVPTLFAGGEMFWGNDRFELVRYYVQKVG